MGVRYFTCSTLLALVLGGVGPAAGAAAQGHLILPGHSIGGFSLGRDLTDLLLSLGPLYEGQDLPNDNFTGYFWPLRRMGVVADKTTNGVVALAITLDDAYVTDKGLTVGATVDAVRGAYGPEDALSPGQSLDTLVYDALGIAFDIDHTGALEGRVSGIFVFLPGHGHELFFPR
jgi:hypothetical protein